MASILGFTLAKTQRYCERKPIPAVRLGTRWYVPRYIVARLTDITMVNVGQIELFKPGSFELTNGTSVDIWCVCRWRADSQSLATKPQLRFPVIPGHRSDSD